jgi:hypothetical protein
VLAGCYSFFVCNLIDRESTAGGGCAAGEVRSSENVADVSIPGGPDARDDTA